MAKIRKTIRKIHVKADLCNGCRLCEIMCSAAHSTPKYNTINPARSRIQIIRDPLKDIWLPVFAGEYTPAECSGRISYEIDNKTYGECAFCRARMPFPGTVRRTGLRPAARMRHVPERSGSENAGLRGLVHP